MISEEEISGYNFEIKVATSMSSREDTTSTAVINDLDPNDKSRQIEELRQKMSGHEANDPRIIHLAQMIVKFEDPRKYKLRIGSKEVQMMLEFVNSETASCLYFYVVGSNILISNISPVSSGQNLLEFYCLLKTKMGRIESESDLEFAYTINKASGEFLKDLHFYLNDICLKLLREDGLDTKISEVDYWTKVNLAHPFNWSTANVLSTEKIRNYLITPKDTTARARLLAEAYKRMQSESNIDQLIVERLEISRQNLISDCFLCYKSWCELLKSLKESDFWTVLVIKNGTLQDLGNFLSTRNRVLQKISDEFKSDRMAIALRFLARMRGSELHIKKLSNDLETMIMSFDSVKKCWECLKGDLNLLMGVKSLSDTIKSCKSLLWKASRRLPDVIRLDENTHRGLVRLVHGSILLKVKQMLNARGLLASKIAIESFEKLNVYKKFVLDYKHLCEKVMNDGDDERRYYLENDDNFDVVLNTINRMDTLKVTLIYMYRSDIILRRDLDRYSEITQESVGLKLFNEIKQCYKTMRTMKEDPLDILNAEFLTSHDKLIRSVEPLLQITLSSGLNTFQMNETLEGFKEFCASNYNAFKSVNFSAIIDEWNDRTIKEARALQKRFRDWSTDELSLPYLSTEISRRFLKNKLLEGSLGTIVEMHQLAKKLPCSFAIDSEIKIISGQIERQIADEYRSIMATFIRKCEYALKRLNEPILTAVYEGCSKDFKVNFEHAFYELRCEFEMFDRPIENDELNKIYGEVRDNLVGVATIEKLAGAIVRIHRHLRQNVAAYEVPFVYLKLIKCQLFMRKATSVYQWNMQGMDNILLENYRKLIMMMRFAFCNRLNLLKYLSGLIEEGGKSIFARSFLLGCNLLDGGYEVEVEERRASIENETNNFKAIFEDIAEKTSMKENENAWNLYTSMLDAAISAAMHVGVLKSLWQIRDYIQHKEFSIGSCFVVNVIINSNSKQVATSIPLDYSPGSLISIVGKITSICWKQACFIPYFTVVKTSSNREVFNHLSLLSFNPSLKSDMTASPYIEKVLNETMDSATKAIKNARAFVRHFDCHWKLWYYSPSQYFDSLYDENVQEDEDTGENLENRKTLAFLTTKIEEFEKLMDEIVCIKDKKIFDHWLAVNVASYKLNLLKIISAWRETFLSRIQSYCLENFKRFKNLVENGKVKFGKEVADFSRDEIMDLVVHLKEFEDAKSEVNHRVKLIMTILNYLNSKRPIFVTKLKHEFEKLPDIWEKIKIQAATTLYKISPFKTKEIADVKEDWNRLDEWQKDFYENFHKYGPFYINSDGALGIIDELDRAMSVKEKEIEYLFGLGQILDVRLPELRLKEVCRRELRYLKDLWDINRQLDFLFASWNVMLWQEAKLDEIELILKQKLLMEDLRELTKLCGKWEIYQKIEDRVKNALAGIRVVSDLKNDALRGRHWEEIMALTSTELVELNDDMTLKEVLDLNLHSHEDEVKDVIERANREFTAEQVLLEITSVWNDMEIKMIVDQRTNSPILAPADDLLEVVDDHQNQLQLLINSRHTEFFENDLNKWQSTLSLIDQNLRKMIDVQKLWQHLETIFIGSQDISQKLPSETSQFTFLDAQFKNICKENTLNLKAIKCMTRDHLYDKLDKIEVGLSGSQKALEGYLEGKRRIFPRFYFVSTVELLEILSNGLHPQNVMSLLIKLFDSIDKLELNENDNIGPVSQNAKHSEFKDKEKLDSSNLQTEIKGELDKRRETVGMYSDDGEYVQFQRTYTLDGQVEDWLNILLGAMREAVRYWLGRAVEDYLNIEREAWVLKYPAQVVLTGFQIWWTRHVSLALQRTGGGDKNALKNYLGSQIEGLAKLTKILLTDLTESDRQKITTLCLINLHSRDVVDRLVRLRVSSALEFPWQSQLRFNWLEDGCKAYICDASFMYQYEYLGNKPRLVITPLTDRCYITLTQSLYLSMGGAPAGPAGTGKTETTKDLGRALGVRVVVSNCSEQMDYSSLGNLFKGLAQSGNWGCFDEFNRITADVLSVVSEQIRTIMNALRADRKVFDFMGTEIPLDGAMGIFITMNPGYAGRTELPENMKALFRPCAMIVPDFDLITELNLVSAGFIDAKYLSTKFVMLYSLCRDLLSKQDHYDWGLRAMKSVLVVAGNLRRADPGLEEEKVLMRALRDFNIPKITTDDLSIFLSLIEDLFPLTQVPRRRDSNFEEYIQKAALDLKFQCEADVANNFILKVTQLQELLDVRHSVFIVGEAGTGKSCIWKTLQHTHRLMSQRAVAVDINPKAVTNNELFGYVNKSTREWRDGLLSSTLRQLALMKQPGPKWIVLDGDIDPMWIESLNTVMDDNKMLTLASNERIPLTPSMRLIFEISHLKSATPATVSRAGILYVSNDDIGCRPIFESWLESRANNLEKGILRQLYDEYVPRTLAILSTKFIRFTPTVNAAHVESLCRILSCMLFYDAFDGSPRSDVSEIIFVWALIWSAAGTLGNDQLGDERARFSKWFLNEFPNLVFVDPEHTIFDYFVDVETKRFALFEDILSMFSLNIDMPLQEQMVPIVEVEGIKQLAEMLLPISVPLMLVGPAGTGKTLLANKCLDALRNLDTSVCYIPMNYYTTCEDVQILLERRLEKLAGRNFGPVGTARLIYFIDDFNLPQKDEYHTIRAHTIIRQYMDYEHWYDRQKLISKEIKNCQYIACMNQNAGNFSINPRLQRHFTTFAVSMPSNKSLVYMLTSILTSHFVQGTEQEPFSNAVKGFVPNLVSGSLNIHNKIATTFLPTAAKPHYIFNLRDISKIYQSILMASSECVKSPDDLVRLYLHEAHRVYGDRMISESDLSDFKKVLDDTLFKEMRVENSLYVYSDPLIYFHYAGGIGMPTYLPVRDQESVKNFIDESLDAYNNANPPMQLALFAEAVAHVCRISRILESPSGNAMLVGVGGSGKQSFARLAAFLGSMEFKVAECLPGRVSNFKVLLNAVYRQTGIKGLNTVLLIPNCEEIGHEYLATINDVLAGIDPIGIFGEDEVTEISDRLRGEARSMGYEQDKDSVWKFFLKKVKIYLKVIVTYSPIGVAMRDAARFFPAIANCMTIDWFHKWPAEALVMVANRRIKESVDLEDDLKEAVAMYMATIHEYVAKRAINYAEATGRHYYTTPKTFLNYIEYYLKSLKDRQNTMNTRIAQFKAGLAKLRSIEGQTAELRVELAAKEVIVNKRSAQAGKLVKIVTAEAKEVARQKALADSENLKLEAKRAAVKRHQESCLEEMEKVKPTLAKAAAALKTLTVESLSDLKSYNNPPLMVTKVLECVLILLRDPKAKGELNWRAARSVMLNVTEFMYKLENYDRDSIPVDTAKRIKKILRDEKLDPQAIRKKSSAASGLCAWVVNMIKYHEVFQGILPKKIALDRANAELESASVEYDKMVKMVANLESQLAKKNKQVEERVQEEEEAIKDKMMTVRAIDLANRLVSGTTDSRALWEKQIVEIQEQMTTMTGDMLLTSAFLTYMGYFSTLYRNDTFSKIKDMLRSNETPIGFNENILPLEHIADDAARADWINHGLPDDDYSFENAAIMIGTRRVPLLVDPQQEGLRWLRQEYDDKMVVSKIDNPGLVDEIISAASNGNFLLIENVQEELNPNILPLLDCNKWKDTYQLSIDGKNCLVNEKFMVVLHTRFANPVFRPEIQALVTLIDFNATPQSLESQLLSIVVESENPALEESKKQTTSTLNKNKVELKDLESSLLKMLSEAEGNFVQNVELVESLEKNVRTSKAIELDTEEAKKLNENIDKSRNFYRSTAIRGTTIFALLSDLQKIHPMYRYNLRAFRTVFRRGVQSMAEGVDQTNRVAQIMHSVTYHLYSYACRGLFEEHKLLLAFQLAISVSKSDHEISDMDLLDFLLRFDVEEENSPTELLSSKVWSAVRRLSSIPLFAGITDDFLSNPKRWESFLSSKTPEDADLPSPWNKINAIERLCLQRALRPDKILASVSRYIENTLGPEFRKPITTSMEEIFDESDNTIPVFFILSPGVDPVNELEAFGEKLGFSMERGNLFNVSLGQGQENLAEQALLKASKQGHWVVLQNIHLVATWLPTLEKILENNSFKGHAKYRAFLTAEPAVDASLHVIPNGILEMSLKITNEPPTGLSINLCKALEDTNYIDCLDIPPNAGFIKQLVFAMCYFHAAITQRRKYGAIGWNKSYPFGMSDLNICVNLLVSHVFREATNVPWTDLRYLIGEIMYGGHITDDWDRRMCRTYLEKFLNKSMVHRGATIYPSFPLPEVVDTIEDYIFHVEKNLKNESPTQYGMHSNVEIKFTQTVANKLFAETLKLQTVISQVIDDAMQVVSREERLLALVENILMIVPEDLSLVEIEIRLTERTPYNVVGLQECHQMNLLLTEIRNSLKELAAGFRGELTMSIAMEHLQECLEMNQVPPLWAQKAYPSLLPLGAWMTDLNERYRELDTWMSSGVLPRTVWLGGLFNPQSFLTAIMQTSARANKWPLDKISLTFGITKRSTGEYLPALKEGVYIHGVYIDGASYSTADGVLVDCVSNEVTELLPVVHVRAVLSDQMDLRGTYECPMYRVRTRGPNYVSKFPLKTKDDKAKWIIAGVAMLLQE